MNILVLSDLHIDTGDNFGLFQWSDIEFISCIERIKKRFSVSKVVLNGDIFELLKYSFSELRNARPVLINYFLNNDFVIIKGNHDVLSTHGKESYRITNSGGQVIHMEHGHNADWLNGNLIGRAFGRLVFFLLGKMSESRFMMQCYLKLAKRSDGINIIPKKYNTLNYLTYALKMLKDCDVVILGHTHKLESHHTYYMSRKKLYINCGSCSFRRFQGVVMNTETLKYELIKETSESFKNSFSMAHAY